MADNQSMTILVVDDQQMNIEICSMHLEYYGFSINQALNGKESVHLIENHDIDLVFMDCMMPIMDGYDATRAIRQLSDPNKAQVPIIALTAVSNDKNREKCLDAGMSDFISKPLDPDEMENVLKRWLPKFELPS